MRSSVDVVAALERDREVEPKRAPGASTSEAPGWSHTECSIRAGGSPRRRTERKVRSRFPYEVTTPVAKRSVAVELERVGDEEATAALGGVEALDERLRLCHGRRTRSARRTPRVAALERRGGGRSTETSSSCTRDGEAPSRFAAHPDKNPGTMTVRTLRQGPDRARLPQGRARDPRVLEGAAHLREVARARPRAARPSSSTRARRRRTACRTTATCSRASSRTSSLATRRCAATTSRGRPAGTRTACRSRSRSRRSSASTARRRSRRTASSPSCSSASSRSSATPRSGRS